jgi:hypothetical protein
VEKSAHEIRIDRFLAARQKAVGIPDSQYVALVEGKVRMGLSTYEALVNAATKPDMTGEEYNTVMEALMDRAGSAPRGMSAPLFAIANSIKDKFGKHAPQRQAGDDRSSVPRDPKAETDALYGKAGPVVHHYNPASDGITCGVPTEEAYVNRYWQYVTCPDCLSYYRPEDDPNLGATPVHYRPAGGNLTACSILLGTTPTVTSDQWRRVTCLKCRRSELAQVTVEKSKADDRSSGTNPHNNGVPMFVHDCTECIFLTRYKGQDLYFHGGEFPTVIARRSGQGYDYTSGLAAAEHDGNLAMAYTIAHRRGLL